MKLKDLSITFHTDRIKECVDFYCNNLQAKLTFDANWYVSIRLESDKPLFLSRHAIRNWITPLVHNSVEA